MRKKIHFMLQLMIHQKLQVAPKNALSNLHIDTQVYTFEVALKRALEVVLKMHLKIDFSSNRASDAEQNVVLDDGHNDVLEGELQSSIEVATENAQKGDRKDPFYVLLDSGLEDALVSAIEGAPEVLFESTPTPQAEIKCSLQVTTEMYLKFHIVVHLLVRKSEQNNLIKSELQEAP